MDVDYWNSLAESYNDHVLEIVQSDINQVLKACIKQLANKRLVAADLGCGAGALLSLLHNKFKYIYAVDHSSQLLDVAKKRIHATNIKFICTDLTKPNNFRLQADVAFCVNVLIAPDKNKREKILRSVFRATKPGGYCIFVVPSYESILHVYRTMMYVDEQQNIPYVQAQRKMQAAYDKEVLVPVDGVVNIGGEPTKLYTQEELLQLFKTHRLNLKRVEKIEYAWQEEIDHPPRYLAEPYPWDWLCVCQK